MRKIFGKNVCPRCPRCLDRLRDGLCPHCNWPGEVKIKNLSEEKCKELQIKWERWQKEEEIKNQAREAVKRAIKKGELVRPERCHICGEKKKGIQAHHWSYEPENWLNVTWVCRRCHGVIHGSIKPTGFIEVAITRFVDSLKERR